HVRRPAPTRRQERKGRSAHRFRESVGPPPHSGRGYVEREGGQILWTRLLWVGAVRGDRGRAIRLGELASDTGGIHGPIAPQRIWRGDSQAALPLSPDDGAAPLPLRVGR